MSSFRHIVPASDGTVSSTTQLNVVERGLSEDVIKRRATTACLACKRRKIKCGGRPLPCDPCRIDHIECILDLSLDGRRKASVKRLQERLEAHRAALRQLLQLVCEPGGQRLQATLPLLQRCVSFQDLATNLQAATAAHGPGPESIHHVARMKQAVALEPLQDRLMQPLTQQSNLNTSNPETYDHLLGLLSILKTAPEDEALRLLRNLQTMHDCPEQALQAKATSTTPYTTTGPDIAIKAEDPQHHADLIPAQLKISPCLSAGFGPASIQSDNENGSSFGSNLTGWSSFSTSESVSSDSPASPFEESTDLETEIHEPNIYNECQHLATHVQKLPALFGAFAEGLDDHIACAAVFHGWEFVEKKVALDPQWEVIHRWDEKTLGLLSDCDLRMSIVDRLACLRLVRRVAKWLAVPDHAAEEVKGSIPNFLWPTPSQQRTEVHELVHYMPWPGVRDVMIQNPSRYQTDTFWRSYFQSVHLDCPFEPICLYDSATTTGMFRITDSFNQRFFDLGCWYLEDQFLDAYPELRPFAQGGDYLPSASIHTTKHQ